MKNALRTITVLALCIVSIMTFMCISADAAAYDTPPQPVVLMLLPNDGFYDIVLEEVTAASGAEVQYGCSADNDSDSATWHSSGVFSGLSKQTYYIFIKFLATSSTEEDVSRPLVFKIEDISDRVDSLSLTHGGNKITQAVPGETVTASVGYAGGSEAISDIIYEWYIGNKYVAEGQSFFIPSTREYAAKTLSLKIHSPTMEGYIILSISTSKLNQGIPPTPSVKERNRTTVTLETIVSPYGTEVSYGYTSGDEQFWQGSPVFSDLTIGKTYYFLAKYSSDSEYFASNISQSSAYMLAKEQQPKPAVPSVLEIGFDKVSLVPAESPSGTKVLYAIGEDAPSFWQESNIFDVSAGSTYNFWIKYLADDNYNESPLSDPAEVIVKCQKKSLCPCFKFTDIKASAWYHTAVDYVKLNGIMSGMSSTKFGVGGNVTRAQIVQTFFNISGDADTYTPSVSNPFKDVKYGDWFYKAVMWAYENNITSGTSRSSFSPNENASREQAVVMLRAFVGSSGTYDHDISAYSDSGKVSVWALDAVKWAIANNVISGKTPSTIDPKGFTTREQFAQIIYNYYA